MTWVKVDDTATDHPKFLALGRDRLAGTGLWLIGLTYANRYLTDGYLPVEALPARTAALARRLVEVGLWDAVSGGYLIHDYAEYQPDRRSVEASRAERQAARSAGGKTRAATATRIGGRFAPAVEQQATSNLAGKKLVELAPTTPAEHQPRPGPARPKPKNSLRELASQEVSTAREDTAGNGARPDLDFLKRRWGRPVSAKQRSILDSIASNERRTEYDVRSGYQWCADVMAQAPPGIDPLGYLIDYEDTLKRQRLNGGSP